MDTRCSEQNRRKAVTQSFRGLQRQKVAKSARPPATREFSRAAGLFFCRRSHNAGPKGFLSPPRGGDKGKPGENRRRKAPRLPHALRAMPVEPPNLTQERICVVAPGEIGRASCRERLDATGPALRGQTRNA